MVFPVELGMLILQGAGIHRRHAMSTGTTVQKAAKKAVNATKQTVNTPLVEGLARAGYVARGAIYALIGLLAAQVAFSNGGEITNQTGAIQMLGAQPFGKVLLI